MPAIQKDRKCEACGGRHTLCLPSVETLDADREYEYDCPSNGRRVRFRPDDAFVHALRFCPPGSVTFRPAG